MYLFEESRGCGRGQSSAFLARPPGILTSPASTLEEEPSGDFYLTRSPHKFKYEYDTEYSTFYKGRVCRLTVAEVPEVPMVERKERADENWTATEAAEAR